MVWFTHAKLLSSAMSNWGPSKIWKLLLAVSWPQALYTTTITSYISAPTILTSLGFKPLNVGGMALFGNVQTTESYLILLGILAWGVNIALSQKLPMESREMMGLSLMIMESSHIWFSHTSLKTVSLSTYTPVSLSVKTGFLTLISL